MASFKLVVFIMAVTLSGLATGNPAKQGFWKGTPMDGMVEEMRASCTDNNDAFSCMKFKVMNFIDTIFKKDSYQITDDIEVRHNGFSAENGLNAARSDAGIMETIEEYIESHDITVKVPVADAKFTISPKNINEDELNIKVKFNEEGKALEARGKSKLKKIFIPILVLVLLKAITVIPLALGVLGIKAWNALQLSFFSFVISLGLAIFNLCKKIATDNHHPHIPAHGPWDAARTFIPLEAVPEINAQNLAYNAYA